MRSEAIPPIRIEIPPNRGNREARAVRSDPTHNGACLRCEAIAGMNNKLTRIKRREPAPANWRAAHVRSDDGPKAPRLLPAFNVVNVFGKSRIGVLVRWRRKKSQRPRRIRTVTVAPDIYSSIRIQELRTPGIWLVRFLVQNKVSSCIPIRLFRRRRSGGGGDVGVAVGVGVGETKGGGVGVTLHLPALPAS